jgi:hypothetical protein
MSGYGQECFVERPNGADWVRKKSFIKKLKQIPSWLRVLCVSVVHLRFRSGFEALLKAGAGFGFADFNEGAGAG